MADLVLTLIGEDRPGLVEAVAECVAARGGNWVESRMARLGGQFAGLLRVEVPDGQSAALRGDVEALSARGLRVMVAGSASAPTPAARPLLLDLVGLDRPGLVREIAHLLAERGVNIEELTTDRGPAAMSGELLFRSRARITLPPGLTATELRARVERLADDLSVRIDLAGE